MIVMNEAIKFFTELPWQIQLIWSLGLFFLTLFFSFFIFLILSRIIKNRKENRLQKIHKLLETLLAEILFDEDYEQLILAKNSDGVRRKVGLAFLSNPESKEVLYNEIIKLHNSYKGELAKKLEDVFKLLGFEEVCKSKIESGKWHISTEGILDANEMELVDLLPIIAPFTNDDQNDLRTAAQNALIQLNANEPFSFLNHLKYPLSDWDQVQLHQALRKYQNHEVPKMSKYLGHPEETVVIFSLKVINDYKQEDSFDKIIECTYSPSVKVQHVALDAVIAIDNELSIKTVVNWLAKLKRNITSIRIALNYLQNQNLSNDQQAILKQYIEHENKVISVLTIEMFLQRPLGKEFIEEYIIKSKKQATIEIVEEVLATYAVIE